jgi:hypothetical protein
MSGCARHAFECKGALSAAMFLAKPFTASRPHYPSVARVFILLRV